MWLQFKFKIYAVNWSISANGNFQNFATRPSSHLFIYLIYDTLDLTVKFLVNKLSFTQLSPQNVSKENQNFCIKLCDS